jgi:hypothetical protein
MEEKKMRTKPESSRKDKFASVKLPQKESNIYEEHTRYLKNIRNLEEENKVIDKDISTYEKMIELSKDIQTEKETIAFIQKNNDELHEMKIQNDYEIELIKKRYDNTFVH